MKTQSDISILWLDLILAGDYMLGQGMAFKKTLSRYQL